MGSFSAAGPSGLMTSGLAVSKKAWCSLLVSVTVELGPRQRVEVERVSLRVPRIFLPSEWYKKQGWVVGR